MAEAHPVGFRWVMKARERGAKLVHVDPRFSRTSAMCQQHVPIRAGSDIALLGGLINHVLTTESWFRDYVMAYTNADTIINEQYVDAEDNGGIFSGFHADTGAYDPTTWMYEGGEIASSAGVREHSAMSFEERTGAGMRTGQVERDPTLEHPRCVLNILRRHFARYTPEVVEEICGIPQADFLRAAQTLVENSGRDRTTMFVYSVGLAHHTSAVQIIRAVGILQLLLGNMGRPGGGIMALRGHASIQGSTDIPTLYDLLPGYLHMPKAARGRADARGVHVDRRLGHRWWSHFDNYIVSLLKAWFGDAATAENDYGFGHLPKITGKPRALPDRDADDGRRASRASSSWGRTRRSARRTPACTGRALGKLKWLVVRDLAEIETATFWRDSPEVRPASSARRTSRPRCSSCPRPRTSRRRAASRRPSASCSGATRRSSRRATRAPSCGSCTT
jgi:formate dehydrogenase major subunit